MGRRSGGVRAARQALAPRVGFPRYDRDRRWSDMFGTVARYLLKAGHEKQFIDEMGSFEGDPPAGWMYHTIFRSTKDPNEIWLSVVFESEEAYRKNADSPDMDREYRRMLEHLQGEPEWHDGHVIHEAMRESPKG